MSALDQHATIKVIDTYGDGWDGAGTISLYRDTKNLTTSNLLPIAQ